MPNQTEEKTQLINIAMVACGENRVAQDAIALINSAILFSYSGIHFHLVVENNIKSVLEKKV